MILLQIPTRLRPEEIVTYLNDRPEILMPWLIRKTAADHHSDDYKVLEARIMLKALHARIQLFRKDSNQDLNIQYSDIRDIEVQQTGFAVNGQGELLRNFLPCVYPQDV